ncbi:Holliday junction resolvase RuvX [Ruania alba]|uniref:Putative pre-16S rRNA nuclease n=1 Tax=Ruania alba TaxID=648782 RepID=A0A1H5FS54_9MICO|nr:Holliday junction resolvase RuvX [Ruania alba]SEE06239.1 putative holliday junction resolvase [Ruania alba]
MRWWLTWTAWVPDGFRTGVRLAIDVGTVRIGVARCDLHGILATPVRTVSRKGERQGLRELAELVDEYDPIEVLVGLPRSLDGGEGPAARAVRAYSGHLVRTIRPVPVRMVDERLTTVTAHQVLHAAGRSSRRHREVVDQVAAVTILEAALDAERQQGTPPGELIKAPDPDHSDQEGT